MRNRDRLIAAAIIGAAIFTPAAVFVVAVLLFVVTLGYAAFSFLENLPGFDSLMPI